MTATDHLHPEQFSAHPPGSSAPAGVETSGAKMTFPKDDTPDVSNLGVGRNPDPQPGVNALPNGIPPKSQVNVAAEIAPPKTGTAQSARDYTNRQAGGVAGVGAVDPVKAMRGAKASKKMG